MNRLGKCFNSNENVLSFTEWSDLEGRDEKEAADMLDCDEGVAFGNSPCDPVVFLQTPKPGERITKAQCGIREHILNSLLKSPRVYSNDILGIARYLFPFYKFPLLQIHIDEYAVDLLKDTNNWAFYIVKRANLKVVTGRQSYVSSLHGHEIEIYTLLPLTETEINEFVNNPEGLRTGNDLLQRAISTIKDSSSTVANIVEQVEYVNAQRTEEYKNPDAAHVIQHLILEPLNVARMLLEIQSYLDTTNSTIVNVTLAEYKNKEMIKKVFPIRQYSSKTDLYVKVAKTIGRSIPFGIVLFKADFTGKYFSYFPEYSFMYKFLVEIVVNVVTANYNMRGMNYDTPALRHKFASFLDMLTTNDSDFMTVITHGGSFRFKIYRVNNSDFSIQKYFTITRQSLERLFAANTPAISFVKLFKNKNLAGGFQTS